MDGHIEQSPENEQGLAQLGAADAVRPILTHHAQPKDQEMIDKIFVYHPPKGDQAIRYEELRYMGKVLAEKIAAHCPSSREKSLAITHLQQTIMWANAAIAINE